MPGMPGAHEPWDSRRSRRPIRDALELLAREIARGGAALGDIRPTILLPIEAWIALQNGATHEFGQPLRADARIGRDDEFRYAGYVFRVDRGA